jgi:PAS domain S-box-containing protein
MSVPPSHNDFFGFGTAEKLASLVNALPDALVAFDEAGSISLVNAHAQAMFGFSDREMVGQPVELLLPERLCRVHPQQSADYLTALQRRAMGSGLELFGRRKDGLEFPVSVSLNVLEASQGQWAIALVRDISEYRKAEEELRSTQLQFQMMVEGVKDYAIFMLDSDGRVTTWNPGAERIKGYSPGEIIGEHFSRLYPLEDAESGKPVRELAIAVAEGRFEEEGSRQRKDGSKFWASVIITPLTDPDGRPQGFVKVTRDITDRKCAEAVVLKAKEEAEKANLAKSEFLSRMSHELRTPLNSVLGYAQLLELQYEDPKLRDSVRSILRAGRHLLGMINEVLDLSRIESGDMAVSIEPVEFAGILDQGIRLVRPIADAAGISVTVLGALCRSVHVQADRQRLVQVLINLLINAVKYNREKGQVTIQCVETRVGTVRIEVADTGHGISLADQSLLFQPFQRFGDLGIEGSGLGLALSKRFTTLMGGTVGLLTSSPQGSTFFIELEQVGPNKPAPVPQTEDLSDTSTFCNSRGTVLYIEDNPSNMALLEAVLASCPGITLIPAAQGTLGIELARKHRPSLILLDVHLPDLMGDVVLERLKLSPETSSIPVVILSADATTRQRTALLAAGAVEYLTKPLDLMRLFEVLNQQLPEQS